MQPKLELAIRRLGRHSILAGVMVTSDFSAGEIAAMEMFAEILANGTVKMTISKKSFTPKNKYQHDYKKHCLSELPTEELWRRCDSASPSHTGGIVIGRDNQLFSFEDPKTTSRTAIISVIEYDRFIDGDHGVLRSMHCIESKEEYTFLLVADTTPETTELVKTLQGDSLMAFYRKPFWTLDDGTPYRLNGTQSNTINDLYKRQTTELIETGSVSDKTRAEMRQNWLNVHDETDYVSYLEAINKACPFFTEKFVRLLTEDEVERISSAGTSSLKREMKA